MQPQYKVLTPEQVDQFLNDGYVVIKQAFTRDKAEEWTRTMWARLEMDPNDKSTWTQERVHMPFHRREPVSEFSPKAWDAMCDLLGGEDRIDVKSSSWGDSFIVNLGKDEPTGKTIAPLDLDNWHVDGDFFVHFLDSPEQALLVIPIFSDIEPRGGGTYVAPDSIERVAKYLYSHPEGVLPKDYKFIPSTSTLEDPSTDPGVWAHLQEIKKCSRFAEMTGQVGDVILLHPLMMHSASRNYLRVPRVITNPPAGLKEPFNLSRDDGAYSLVERKTLKALGVERCDFKITTERRRVVPARQVKHQLMKEEEQRRIARLVYT